MKINLKHIAAALIGLSAQFSSADLIVFQGDSTIAGGWEAFEAVSGYDMSIILSPPELPNFSILKEIDTPDGPCIFDPPHDKRSEWINWGHSPQSLPVTAELFWTKGATTTTYSPPPGALAYDMYANRNPDSGGKYTVTIVGSNATALEFEHWINGASDWANHLGVYSTDGEFIESVTLSGDADFAIAEMRYATLDTPCNADLTGDGIVNPEDLAQLLGQWGQCPFCPADLTLDSHVGLLISR